MKTIHVPTIDNRYWTAIALASVFGTNMGDLYAHNSGLGYIGGLLPLAALFALVFVAERFDKKIHDAYYWLCIIILRTGATNIADYAAGRHGLAWGHLNCSIGCAVLFAGLVWWLAHIDRRTNTTAALKTVPSTDTAYWVTMLTAGVLGTLLGDYLQDLLGRDAASVSLTVLFVVVLLMYRKAIWNVVVLYWLIVAVARTTGTAIGDWLAESPHSPLGLALSTLLSGACLAAVLIVWRGQRPPVTAQA
jgi:uncharacterized membrane-anchored protein